MGNTITIKLIGAGGSAASTSASYNTAGQSSSLFPYGDGGTGGLSTSIQPTAGNEGRLWIEYYIPQ